MIDFADLNTKVAIAFSLTLIAGALVYIAFKLSEKSSKKGPPISHTIKNH